MTKWNGVLHKGGYTKLKCTVRFKGNSEQIVEGGIEETNAVVNIADSKLFQKVFNYVGKIAFDYLLSSFQIKFL